MDIGRRKQRILIVDDDEINRSILMDMMDDAYEYIEAEDGAQAVSILKEQEMEISLVLLDIMMPVMDGFGVLQAMNENHWIDSTPVVIISSESQPDNIAKAYDLGVTDFIGRPFNDSIVHHRVTNTLLLAAKQHSLEELAAEQIYEKERHSGLMVDILSHIVEFRNGESSLHVIHVRAITELLLKQLQRKTDRYPLTPAEISMISTVSSFHDIGKISIDAAILNKPGKLTDEEFAVMKTHAMVGAEMLAALPVYQDEPLVNMAYQVCRWHHERYNGRGYPDGLSGDDIPISAQVVALADVYDALTSERVYKPAFSHEHAMEIIAEDGARGAFNPILLECLNDISDILRDDLRASTLEKLSRSQHLEDMAVEISRHKELAASNRTLQLLEQERMKYGFFAAMSEEIQFEYTPTPPMVTFNAFGAKKLGVNETVLDPAHNSETVHYMEDASWEEFHRRLLATTPEEPSVVMEGQITIGGEARWHKFIARSLWTADEPPRMISIIGKATDIHRSRMNLEQLERRASYDALTDLLNAGSARKKIEERLKAPADEHYALAILDLDFFKTANDTYGHAFGNEVLALVAETLKRSVRGGDIAARIGGDEFLVFLEYKQDLEPIIDRIFHSICGKRCGEFTISLSVGVATASDVGNDYENLFRAADQALYTVKESGKGNYCFYDQSVREMAPLAGSKIGAIESEEGEGER